MLYVYFCKLKFHELHLSSWKLSSRPTPLLCVVDDKSSSSMLISPERVIQQRDGALCWQTAAAMLLVAPRHLIWKRGILWGVVMRQLLLQLIHLRHLKKMSTKQRWIYVESYIFLIVLWSNNYVSFCEAVWFQRVIFFFLFVMSQKKKKTKSVVGRDWDWELTNERQPIWVSLLYLYLLCFATRAAIFQNLIPFDAAA